MELHSALVVEDLREPREWLCELLPRALPGLRRVDAAATLAEARERAAHLHYDLGLLDWGLPDGTAEPLIRELVARTPPTLVIVSTIHDDDAHVFPALQAGALGYLLKSQPRDEVEGQLRRIARGEPPLSPSVALRILGHFRQTRPAAAARPAVRLTERELDVLRLLGKGYRAAEIGELLSLTVNTVNSYVREIYGKLGISSRAEAALEASRRGLVQ